MPICRAQYIHAHTYNYFGHSKEIMILTGRILKFELVVMNEYHSRYCIFAARFDSFRVEYSPLLALDLISTELELPQVAIVIGYGRRMQPFH